MLGRLHNIDNRGDILSPVKMSRYVRFPACTRVKRTGEYLSSPDAERTPETVCPSRSSAVSWFRLPGQGARDDERSFPPGDGGPVRMLAGRPGLKCPAFTRVV